jgi:iron complex outermembrane receptor protein
LQGLLVYWTTDSDTSHPTSYLRDSAGATVYTGPVSLKGKVWDTSTLNLGLNERTEILTGLAAKTTLSNWDLSVNLSHFWLAKAETFTSNGYTNGVNNGPGTFTQVDPSAWWTLDAKATQTFGMHEVTLGLSSNRYETDSVTYSTANWRTATHKVYAIETQGKSNLSGVFAEDELHLSDSLSVTAGVRFEQWKAYDGSLNQASAKSAQYYDERQETDSNLSLSTQWAFADHWSAQLSLATATRFPTVGELFQGKFSSAGIFDEASFDPDLHPEKSQDVNLIIRHQFEQARITGSIFYQDVEDFIFSYLHPKVDPVTQLVSLNNFTTSFVNIERVRQTGAELIVETYDLLAPGLSLDFNIAYIDDKIIKNSLLPSSEGSQFPRIPYWRINSQARYQVAQNWRLSGGVRYASRPNNNLEATERGDTFGYASEQLISDIRLSWQADGHTELSIGVDNLNNDKAWAFHPFAQRTFLVEAKWKN